MATPTDISLIDDVRHSANRLGIAANWANTTQPLSIEDDFLYELFVLFRLITSLQKEYVVKYIPGDGENAHCFPKKPANKNGRPRFDIYTVDGKRICQICAGTKIKDIHGTPHTPDISFQTGNASDEPGYNDLILIWDAKYRKDNTSRISNSEVAVFGRWLELFDLRGKSPFHINLDNLSQLFGNCLISNGDFSTEPDIERKRLWLKEVSQFHPNTPYSIRP